MKQRKERRGLIAHHNTQTVNEVSDNTAVMFHLKTAENPSEDVCVVFSELRTNGELYPPASANFH